MVSPSDQCCRPEPGLVQAGSVTVCLMSGSTVVVPRRREHMRIWEVKHQLEKVLGKRSEAMQLLAGAQVLSDWESVPRGSGASAGAAGADEGEPLAALTLVQLPRLPLFLERHGLQNLNDRNFDGTTVLHMALDSDDVELCGEILEKDDLRTINDVDFLGNTVLHQAATRGLTSVCVRILEHEAFRAVNRMNSNGHTALHLASGHGDLEACKAILRHPLFEDSSGVDALGHTAADLWGLGA